MRVIVLAAGFATRLYPLTRDRAKPLLEVGGRPVLARLLDRILAVGDVTDVLVVTNARFRAQFDSWRDGYESDVPIRIVDDGSTDDSNKLGAIGDLALAWDHAPDGDAEDVLVAAGDNLVDFDLAPFAARFRRVRRPVVMARRLPDPVPPARYGEIVLGEANRIVSFREKPEDPRSDVTSICLYLFPTEVRALLAEYLASGADTDAPGHFLAWLCGRVPVDAEMLTGRYFDIGNLETLEAAREAFAES